MMLSYVKRKLLCRSNVHTDVSVQGNDSIASVQVSHSKRQNKKLLFAYAVFILILLGSLSMQEHVVKQPTNHRMSAVPSALVARVNYLYPRLVWNTDPSETMAFSYDSTPHGPMNMTWGVSCESPNHAAYLLFRRGDGSVVQFSQSAHYDWSADRQQWTVNDAQTATREGLRYLSTLGWETPGCHWTPEGKPQLMNTYWLLIYHQGKRRASLHIHRWNSVLLVSMQDSMKR